MVLKSALLYGYLLSSLFVLAIPSSLSDDLLVLRRELGRLEHNEHLEQRDHPGLLTARAENNSYWAGALLSKETDGSITFVSGQFTVPRAGYPNVHHTARGIFVIGIDGVSSCGRGSSFLAGVTFQVKDLLPNNWAFFEWTGVETSQSLFSVLPGDTIWVDVVMNHAASVSVTIANVATPTSPYFTREYLVTPEHALCMREAVWGVSVLHDYAFPNFGTLTIEKPAASGPEGVYPWSDTTPINLLNFDALNNYNVTTAINSGSTLQDDYVVMTHHPE